MSRIAIPKKLHRRYDDRPERLSDLGTLPWCNNIGGSLSPERLTSDDRDVTCRRCLRLIEQRKTLYSGTR